MPIHRSMDIRSNPWTLACSSYYKAISCLHATCPQSPIADARVLCEGERLNTKTLRFVKDTSTLLFPTSTIHHIAYLTSCQRRDYFTRLSITWVIATAKDERGPERVRVLSMPWTIQRCLTSGPTTIILRTTTAIALPRQPCPVTMCGCVGSSTSSFCELGVPPLRCCLVLPIASPPPPASIKGNGIFKDTEAILSSATRPRIRGVWRAASAEEALAGQLICCRPMQCTQRGIPARVAERILPKLRQLGWVTEI